MDLMLFGHRFLACQQSTQSTSEHQSTSSDSGSFIVKTLQPGTGDPLEPGDDAIIEEEMKYSSGPILFSTAELGHPIRFTVGAGQVTEGIDSGIRGMKVGEVRELVIPPRLSKRVVYPDFLSPDSILHYKITLVEVIRSDSI